MCAYQNQIGLFSKDTTALKRKLRELKHLEMKLRYGTNFTQESPQPSLIWNQFFDTKLHESGSLKAKYSLSALAVMSREEYRDVLSDYWNHVFLSLFGDLDLSGHKTFDPALLLQLGLPFEADEAAVKKRFRELAKQYHPDMGGDAAQFIALMDSYRKLIGK